MAEASASALLAVSELEVAYGKAVVVREVAFEVQAGEFVVMLGRNGAGKSTILHAVSGLIPKRKGRVRFAGQDITHATARTIVQRGLVQVLQGHRVFTSLTVEDNLLLGTYATGGRNPVELERVYALFPELAERRQQPASRLSGGQQQILAVAQGVIAHPRLLMLDEPSSGLAPLVVDRILDVASSLCREGLAILLVEQLVDKALRHANVGYLIETGRVMARATAAELAGSTLLEQIYLGGHAPAAGGAS
jgi:branched-chain amino acid transport system ATP-binding protein